MTQFARGAHASRCTLTSHLHSSDQPIDIYCRITMLTAPHSGEQPTRTRMCGSILVRKCASIKSRLLCLWNSGTHTHATQPTVNSSIMDECFRSLGIYAPPAPLYVHHHPKNLSTHANVCNTHAHTHASTSLGTGPAAAAAAAPASRVHPPICQQSNAALVQTSYIAYDFT